MYRSPLELDIHAFDDLLDVPYLEDGVDPSVGLNCLGLVAEVYRRLGVDRSPFPMRGGGETVETYVDRVSRHGWRTVGKPYQAGDVLLMDSDRGKHVAVMVSPTEALHCSEDHGVARIRANRFQRVIGVYRCL